MSILWKNSYAIKKWKFLFLIFFLLKKKKKKKKNVYFAASCVAQMRYLQALSCYPMLHVNTEF